MTDEFGPRRRAFAARLDAAGLAPPTEAEDHALWQIVDEGVLGASRHVALSLELLGHILDAAETPEAGLARARLAAQAISETRGADAPVIANTLTWLTAGLDEEGDAVTALRDRIRRFDAEATARRAALIRAACVTIGGSARILAFDYSSTVAAIVHALHEAEVLERVVVPESRCIAGGRRYLESFLPAGIAVTYLPDAAIDHAIALSETVLLGAESLHADGGFLNTVGSRVVAERTLAAGGRVFGATDMFKLDRRSYAGAAPTPRLRRFDALMAPDIEAAGGGVISTEAPELERIPPGAATAILTEHGPVPQASIWSLGRELFGSGDNF